MKEPFVMEAHSWGKLKFLPWSICKRCGLVRLRNEFTEWAIKQGCNNEDHPRYEIVRRQLTASP